MFDPLPGVSMRQWALQREQFVLCDINNFYVAAERAFDPRLRNKPVAVYSNGDGCVIARSPEVKALGVKMGAPAFELREQFRRHGVIVRSSNYTLYHDMSSRFVQVLEQFCVAEGVQQYSIDEAFLVFRGYGSELEEHCQRMLFAVHRWTGMPACAGIGPTRTLAKAANHFAKTLGVSGGVLQVRDEYHRQQLLLQLPVHEVWGVGERLAAKLAMLGIGSALDLSCAHLPTLRKAYGVTVERTARELAGTSCIKVAPMGEPRQEIVSGRTFGKWVADYAGVMAAVANHVLLAVEKLAAQDGRAGRLAVSIQGRDSPSTLRREASAYTELRPATGDPRELLAAARTCLNEIFRPNREYKRASVMLSNLRPRGELQGDMFEGGRSSSDAVECLASINRRFGRGTATFASAQLSHNWQMKREFLSPAYTTDFQQLPRVHTG